MKPLLTKLRAAGFFKLNEAVAEEIGDNDYAFYEPGDPLAALEKRGLACYSRSPGGEDRIFLREDIFAHCDVRMEGVMERRGVHHKILTVLVHELCHDLWTNTLGPRERLLFEREAEDFIIDYIHARATGGRALFPVPRDGENPNPGRLRSYTGLDDLLEAYRSPGAFGAELFAWLAERAFAADLEIPSVFRKYYAGLLDGLPSGPPGAPSAGRDGA